MTPREILENLRTLLTPRSKWTQTTLRRTQTDGTMAYCLIGGMNAIQKGGERRKASRLLSRAINDYRGQGIIRFNDSSQTHHKDILKVIDTSIEYAREAELKTAVKQEHEGEAVVLALPAAEQDSYQPENAPSGEKMVPA